MFLSYNYKRIIFVLKNRRDHLPIRLRWINRTMKNKIIITIIIINQIVAARYVHTPSTITRYMYCIHTMRAGKRR